jgi:hypothetical protein
MSLKRARREKDRGRHHRTCDGAALESPWVDARSPDSLFEATTRPVGDAPSGPPILLDHVRILSNLHPNEH